MKFRTALAGGLLGVVLLTLPARAQEIDDFEELDLEELLDVVYAAARHRQDIAESPSAIAVIDREMIENTHCTDVVCLLRQVPEVDVMRVTPMWISVGARALTNEFGDKILVLVDGQEVNIEVFGVTVWQALPVHLEEIERIEVIRGPGSALYGANAHSAVITITTCKINQDSATVYVGGGEHGRLSAHARADRKLGSWGLHLSGGADLANNWQKQGEIERDTKRLRLRVEREVDSVVTTVQAGVQTVSGLAFILLIPARLKECMLTNVILRHQTDRLRGQVTFFMAQGNFDLDFPMYYEDTKLGEVAGDMVFLSTNLDAEGELQYSPFAGNLLIGGANYRWVTFISDQVAPRSTNQHRVGAYLQDEQRLFDSLVLTGGVRLDYNTISPFAVSPRLAAVWRLRPGQVVRAAFATAFRKPSFLNTSLHLTNVRDAEGMTGISDFLRRSVGNDKLENESITTLEAGYHGRFLGDALVAQADVFYNRYRNTINLRAKIFWDLGMPDLNRSIYRFENTGMEVDSVGGSLSLTYRIKERLWLSANYTLRYSWFIGDARDESSIGEKGDRVPFEPAHLLNLSGHFISRTGLRLGAAVHGASERTFHVTYGGEPFAGFTPMHVDAHVFLSGFVAYRVETGPGWFEVGLRAYNALDSVFWDRPSVTGRGEKEMGGEPISRRLFLFLRGAI
jgi:outer membrane receptor for ferrienterochelin and colicin